MFKASTEDLIKIHKSTLTYARSRKERKRIQRLIEKLERKQKAGGQKRLI